jgi:predicted Zn-dependent protease
MLTREESQKLAEKVISLSTYPECQVNISDSEQVYTRFANNGITTAAFSRRHAISVSVTRDNQTGSYTVADFDESNLKALVSKAEELAAIAPPNPERLPALGPQQYPKTFDFDERTATARSPEMIPHVKTIVDAAVAKKLVAAGLVLRTHTVSAVANKAGLFGYHNASDSQLTTTIRMPDGSSSGWAGQPSIKLSEIDSAKLAHDAIEKCIRWKNPQKIEPGNYSVVLEPTAAGDLVRLITPGFSARGTEEGRTFISKRGGGTLVGEKVFPDFITLRSDPFDPRQPSSPWSAELLPNQAMTWIDKGSIANLAYDRYWASKTGKQPTPGGFGGGFGGGGGGGFGGGMGSDLILEGGDASLDQLIASVDRGVLVTHFWYIRFVNQQTLQQTGLTRDGLFLIENGKITTPITNFRFLESPVRLLKNAKRLGTAQRVRGLEGGMMISPAILASDFPLTSVSDAI